MGGQISNFITYVSLLSLLSLSTLTTAIDPRWYRCGPEGNYTVNSTFITNLGRALDYLQNSTSPTGFNATTSSDPNGNQSVTAAALCRGDLEPPECQTCIDMATSGIVEQCPARTEAEIWYDHCTLRYSNMNFLTRPNDSIVFYIWDTREVPESDIYNRKVQVLGNNLSVSAGTSDTNYAAGKTKVSGNLTLYGLYECTRDLSGEDCAKCLSGVSSEIERCCLGRWAVWIGAVSCAIRLNVDGIFNDTVSALEVMSDSPPPSSPPEILFRSGDSNTNHSGARIRVAVGSSVAVVGGLVLSGLFLWVVMRKRKIKKRKGQGKGLDEAEEVVSECHGMGGSFMFDLGSLLAATDNFSAANRLGSGGFGVVYKGKMPNGEEIAVKKLSVGSAQGFEEFSNEVRLLLKIEHRNLVKLFGCCVQEQERMLVYQYHPNKSLDHFIFDKRKGVILDWPKRFNIIMGIARGLLYLHQDSQIRIIHRDIKAGNILLDQQMIPKISDFGLAKLFPDEQTHLRTRKIAGTFGYMAPEYAVHGLVSTKSDVFSYGVLILEIVSGRKTYDDQLDEESRQLLDLTWRLDQQGRLMELVDVTLGPCNREQVTKCLRIGLLCCQENARDRPDISSVTVMLSNDTVTVPLPGRPGYHASRYTGDTRAGNSNEIENNDASKNTITMTLVSGR